MQMLNAKCNTTEICMGFLGEKSVLIPKKKKLILVTPDKSEKLKDPIEILMT